MKNKMKCYNKIWEKLKDKKNKWDISINNHREKI